MFDGVGIKHDNVSGKNVEKTQPIAGQIKQIYQKKNVGEDQNRIVALASKISNNDLEWILTLEGENGLWDMYRLHPNQNKDKSWDFACGLNSYYHKDMIKKIKAKSVSEEEILKYCREVYLKRKSAFYAWQKLKKDSAHYNKLKSRFYLITTK